MRDLYLFETKGRWYVETDGEDLPIGDDGDLYQWMCGELGLGRYIPITLMAASEEFGVPYSTVAEWVREGKVEARKEAGTWLVTRAAMEGRTR